VTRRVIAGCMHKVSNFIDIASCCEMMFDKHKMVVLLEKVVKMLVHLMLILFGKMLQLPTPYKDFKVSEENEFMKAQGGCAKILRIFYKEPISYLDK